MQYVLIMEQLFIMFFVLNYIVQCSIRIKISGSNACVNNLLHITLCTDIILCCATKLIISLANMHRLALRYAWYTACIISSVRTKYWHIIGTLSGFYIFSMNHQCILIYHFVQKCLSIINVLVTSTLILHSRIQYLTRWYLGSI